MEGRFERDQVVLFVGFGLFVEELGLFHFAIGDFPPFGLGVIEHTIGAEDSFSFGKHGFVFGLGCGLLPVEGEIFLVLGPAFWAFECLTVVRVFRPVGNFFRSVVAPGLEVIFEGRALLGFLLLAG